MHTLCSHTCTHSGLLFTTTEAVAEWAWGTGDSGREKGKQRTLEGSDSTETPAVYLPLTKLLLASCWKKLWNCEPRENPLLMYFLTRRSVDQWQGSCTSNYVIAVGRFWTVVLEKSLESPFDCKEIPPVHPKGNQSWMFIGRTDAEAETPIFWPPDVKNWLIWKDPDAGRDWGQEEKRVTEDELVGWHHRLNEHVFE